MVIRVSIPLKFSEVPACANAEWQTRKSQKKRVALSNSLQVLRVGGGFVSPPINSSLDVFFIVDRFLLITGAMQIPDRNRMPVRRLKTKKALIHL
jgi:hypothetical protein